VQGPSRRRWIRPIEAHRHCREPGQVADQHLDSLFRGEMVS